MRSIGVLSKVAVDLGPVMDAINSAHGPLLEAIDRAQRPVLDEIKSMRPILGSIDSSFKAAPWDAVAREQDMRNLEEEVQKIRTEANASSTALFNLIRETREYSAGSYKFLQNWESKYIFADFRVGFEVIAQEISKTRMEIKDELGKNTMALDKANDDFQRGQAEAMAVLHQSQADSASVIDAVHQIRLPHTSELVADIQKVKLDVDLTPAWMLLTVCEEMVYPLRTPTSLRSLMPSTILSPAS